MDELKVYTNKNIGSFLSIPASKIAKTNNLEDSIYFSRHLNKLRNKSIDELRGTKHYKSKTQQYAKSLEGIDTTSLKDMSTKLKLNIKMYNPLAKTTDTKYKEGGSVRKSYKTIELLQVSKNSFKPMLFLGGTPNAAARSFIGFRKGTSRNMTRPDYSIKPQRQQTHSLTSQDVLQKSEIKESLVKDFIRLIKSIKGQENPNALLSDFISNPMYDELHSLWDPTKMIFEDVDDLENDDDQNGGIQVGGFLDGLALNAATFSQIYEGIKIIVPTAIMLIKLTGKFAFFIVQVPPNLIKQQEKNLFMVLHAEIGSKNVINYHSAKAVGVFLSKNEAQNIKSLRVHHRTFLWWFSKISGNPQKWAESIGNQLRTDVQISPDKFNKLKEKPSQERNKLLQNLKLQFADNKRMLGYLELVSNDQMDSDLWVKFQGYASIPRNAISTAKSNETINSIVGMLFLMVFFLSIFLILNYKPFDYGRTNIHRKFLRDKSVQNVVEAMEEQTTLVVDQSKKSLQEYYYGAGKYIYEIYDEGVNDTIEELNLSGNIKVSIICQLTMWVNKVRNMNINFFSAENEAALTAQMVSFDDRKNQLASYPDPKTQILSEALSQFDKTFGLYGQTRAQEAVKDKCIWELSKSHKLWQDYKISSIIYGDYIKDKDKRAELIKSMLANTLRCEVLLNDKYRDIVRTEVRVKYNGKYYGFDALRKLSNIDGLAIEELKQLAKSRNYLRERFGFGESPLMALPST